MHQKGTVHGMIPINPITGAALPVALAQQQLATDKVRQVRREQVARRNVAAAEDIFLHTVENAEAVTGVNADGKREQPNRQPQHRHSEEDDAAPDDQEPPHLDLVG
jgi:hypothetical protein